MDEKVVSLENFHQIPSRTINSIHALLKQQGFVFFTLPESLSSLITKCKPKLSKFFALSAEEKDKYTIPSSRTKNDSYGYNISPEHKEGLRFLSGTKFDSKLVPSSCDPELSKLVSELDDAIINLTASISPTVFGLSIDELAQKYPLPLLNLKNKNKKKLDEKDEKTQSFGMIDVAYYLNKKPLESGLNCVAHTDPGLFSLNILNTQPGLQFQNHEKKWIDGPVDDKIGVLWTGDLAPIVSKEIPKCYHRVTFPSVSKGEVAPPRMSIWIELCTKDQELDQAQKMLNMVAAKDGDLLLPSVQLTAPAPLVKTSNKNGKKVPMASIPIKKGETLSAALSRASRQFGMPMSKSIRYYCPLCLSAVGSLLSHFNEKHEGQSYDVD